MIEWTEPQVGQRWRRHSDGLRVLIEQVDAPEIVNRRLRYKGFRRSDKLVGDFQREFYCVIDSNGNMVRPAPNAVIDRTNEQQCPVCFMADLDHGSGPETIQIWTMYHDSHCSGRWASTTGSEQQCGRGPCYLGNGHEGECEPGPSIRPAGSEQP